MFIEVPLFSETSHALKNFWLRACSNLPLLHFMTSTKICEKFGNCLCFSQFFFLFFCNLFRIPFFSSSLFFNNVFFILFLKYNCLSFRLKVRGIIKSARWHQYIHAKISKIQLILYYLTLCCHFIYFSIRQKSSIRKVLTLLECLPVTDVSQAFSII